MWDRGKSDWDGAGVSPPVVLTGDQCLVFFWAALNNPPDAVVSAKAPTRQATDPFRSIAGGQGTGNNIRSDPYGKVPYAYLQ